MKDLFQKFKKEYIQKFTDEVTQEAEKASIPEDMVEKGSSAKLFQKQQLRYLLKYRREMEEAALEQIKIFMVSRDVKGKGKGKGKRKHDTSKTAGPSKTMKKESCSSSASVSRG